MPLRWMMLIVLFLVRLAMGYQFQSVASISPYLAAEVGLSYAEIGTLIGLFLLPGVFIAIPSGVVTRTVSNKNLLMVGAVTMIAGAFIMALGSGAQTLFIGRLISGIGGTIFNVILTKMVTEWFFKKEIVSALAVMLTAWPIGIALGLLTQGAIADAWHWPLAIHATALLAFASLLLTAVLYQDPPVPENTVIQPLRFGLPHRQLVHMCVVGSAWALYNACLITMVSFTPDVLVSHGLDPAHARTVTSLAMWATLLSIPLGGRVMEVFGWITVSIIGTLVTATAILVGLSQGMAPVVLCIAFGLIAGIPAGALVALSSEAVSPDHRGPGLGIFYTGYYIGMTTCPSLAGWVRDVSGSPAAPVLLAGAMLVCVIMLVVLFRVLQAVWPIAGARDKPS